MRIATRDAREGRDFRQRPRTIGGLLPGDPEMLFAHGALRYDPTIVRLHIAFGRRLELKVIERAHCTYDTRWLPSRTIDGRGRLIFHVYLEGSVELAGTLVPTPFVLLGTESHYCGTKERRPAPLRAGGARFSKIELTLPTEDVRLPYPTVPVVLPTTESFFATARAFAEAMRREEDHADAQEKLLEAWMKSLGDEGWIGAETFKAFSEPESSALLRLWRAFAPSFSTFDLNLSLGLLSSRAGITARQVARNVDELLVRTGHPVGFRALLAEWRLRAAVMLLSAPHATVEEVAKIVGYASVESLAASFRDAGLPPPREVQAEVSRPFVAPLEL